MKRFLLCLSLFCITISGFSINEHEYVDLGLPSGLKWATCNIGAANPEDYGDYFAWGETEPKEEYTEENYILQGVEMGDISWNPQYDVATANWGINWRMPTQADYQELVEKCTWKWKIQNGVKGYNVIGPNGDSIFFHAAGHRKDKLYREGQNGYYYVLRQTLSITNMRTTFGSLMGITTHAPLTFAMMGKVCALSK